MSIIDPREEISHDICIGQVYKDLRTEEKILLTYLDSYIAILRDMDESHRLESRDLLERYIGAGRFKLQPDADGFGETGRLHRVMGRADEYEERGGRKASHYADAMREAVEILTDQGAEDAREPVEFEEVSGIGEQTAAALRAAGYRTRGDVRSAGDDELLAVSGMGGTNLDRLRDRVG